MEIRGTLDKMPTVNIHPVNYFLPIGEKQISLNENLGKEIRLRHTGKIFCMVCGKSTRKSFAEGLCFNCFENAPENSECILFPERCLAHEHKGRDVAWELRNHLQPHTVYLTLVDKVKVGVTRDTQIPTRWIDQGANQAVILAQTPYRQLAGAIEVFLKKHLSDKTNWQRMLKNEFAETIDLLAEKARIADLLPDELRQYIFPENEIIQIDYPVLAFPKKITSLSFDKTPDIRGVLSGIKGQYLIFDTDEVLNIRKHSGYEIDFSVIH